MQVQKSSRKYLQQNKKYLDDLIKRRHIYFQSAQIYGGCGGLYDLGPIGCSLKNNIEQLWRDHFIFQQDMLEINTTCVTPEIVLQNSGHVAKFTDLMVKDVKNGQGFRADKLISQWIQSKIAKDKSKLKQDQLTKFKQITTHIDSYKNTQIDELIKTYKIKSPQTGNQLTNSQPFNLMFKTLIGPSSNYIGYLRPQTAQGIFINFNKLLDYNCSKLPFAVAQIGLGFRNQIAPRSGLIRVRQFTMAEIQYFVDPLNKSHPKFKSVANTKLPLLSGLDQQSLKQHTWIEIGQAVANKTVNNQTIAYFLVRIYQFLQQCGINVTEHLRFRQHMKNQMAHYACDCWDAQIQMSHGWIQCVGCADRSAYDLQHHSSGSGQKLLGARKFKQSIPTQITKIIIEKQVVGKQFKKNSQQINTYLDKLSQENKKQLKKQFDQKNQILLKINDKQYKLDKKHLHFQQQIINVSQQKFTPNVIQPSFGLGRIMTGILQHCFKSRDQKRTYLCLKPKIAPTKVSILPLQQDQRFHQIIQKIKKLFKKKLVSCKVDDTGQSIGKRYSRTDQIGIPFALTIDYKTLQDQTLTLRQLHSMKQIRIPLDHIDNIVCQLALQHINWNDISKLYPQFKTDIKDQ